MTDNPFADVVDAIFSTDGISYDAFYSPGSGQPVIPVRLVLLEPDDEVNIGNTNVVIGTHQGVVRTSEVPNPKRGHTFEVELPNNTVKTLTVEGQPQGDNLGLEWRLRLR
jgi:hypothetical protein